MAFKNKHSSWTLTKIPLSNDPSGFAAVAARWSSSWKLCRLIRSSVEWSKGAACLSEQACEDTKYTMSSLLSAESNSKISSESGTFAEFSHISTWSVGTHATLLLMLQENIPSTFAGVMYRTHDSVLNSSLSVSNISSLEKSKTFFEAVAWTETLSCVTALKYLTLRESFFFFPSHVNIYFIWIEVNSRSKHLASLVSEILFNIYFYGRYSFNGRKFFFFKKSICSTTFYKITYTQNIEKVLSLSNFFFYPQMYFFWFFNPAGFARTWRSSQESNTMTLCHKTGSTSLCFSFWFQTNFLILSLIVTHLS